MATKITCVYCKAELGISVSVDDAEDIEFLQVGGVLFREAHGICPHCGTAFYWSISDQRLERLVRLVEKLRMNML